MSIRVYCVLCVSSVIASLASIASLRLLCRCVQRLLRPESFALPTRLTLETLWTLYARDAIYEATKRNRDRFPSDFMFQLTTDESEKVKSYRSAANLKSQIATSSSRWGGRRHRPYAFTEQGVAMLSSVLRSRRAIQVNVAIMRAFVKLREMVSSHKELAAKLAELERKVGGHDTQIQSLFEAIRQLMEPPDSKRRIGFQARA